VTRPNSTDQKEPTVPLPRSEVALLKELSRKDDIRQASIGTSAGEGGGNLEGDWLAGRADAAPPSIAPSRGCVQPTAGWHLRASADRQTRVFWAQVNKDAPVKDRSATLAEPAAAAIIATLAPTLRAQRGGYTANCFTVARWTIIARRPAAQPTNSITSDGTVHWQERRREKDTKALIE